MFTSERQGHSRNFTTSFSSSTPPNSDVSAFLPSGGLSEFNIPLQQSSFLKLSSTTVTISATDAIAAERTSGQTANPGKFTITRTGDTETALIVEYSVAGTATKGIDYNNLSGTITIPIGSTSINLPINVIDDTQLEGRETSVVTLNSSNAYTLGDTTTATVGIADNEKPTVTITATDANAAERTSEQTANRGRFTITRTGSTTTALTVKYNVAGTATKGTDYNNLSGTITIPIGASSVNLPINVIDDDLVEGRETAVVTLNTNNAYTLGDTTTATVAIADNEKPTVTITATDVNAAERTVSQTANSGRFTITRTGGTTNALTVKYSVAGTATKGTDYNNLTGTVVIPAGKSSITVPIKVIDDALVEGTETAVLTLSSNNAYILGNTVTATVNIADDEPTTPDAGNTLATADEQASAVFSRNQQVRSSDLNDFYRFTVGESGIFTADLSNLTGDADVRLIQDTNNDGEINQGEVIAWQWERGNDSESIRRFINAGTYFLQVNSYNNHTANYRVATDFTAAASDDLAFSIQLDFGDSLTPGTGSLSGLNQAAQDAILEAAKFWENVITYRSAISDIGPFIINITGEALNNGDGSPDNSTLAFAGPSLGSDGTSLTITSGAATINTRQLEDFNANPDYIQDVMTHEFAHVLGIGTLWEPIQFQWGDGTVFNVGSNLIDRTTETYRADTYAGWAYGELTGTFTQSAIPVEPGVFGHWDESTFDEELMTPFAEFPGTPLPASQLTIASLRDIGWNVNYGAAEPYLLPI